MLILQDGEPTHLVNGVLFEEDDAFSARSMSTRQAGSYAAT